ncbi:hypothetical protein CJF31_00001044 [Rutstroemia sp. NJR-2017a BVV2]|nr:hypothetical protein CJF31_00001044 [Rutstroemia sp. NJR-2017a BVV2]
MYITKGKALKKAVTNDRSAPIVGKVSGSSGPASFASAPPVPGMAKPPGGLAPPVPGGNRGRSNSDQDRDSSGATGMEQPPQLAGIFAGGIPKLKKRGGGVDTGANRESSYASDPESSHSSVPKPPSMAAPRPPTGAAPPLPNVRPPNQTAVSTPAFVPSIANLRKTGAPSVPRSPSSASLKGPPPPIGKKPPPPPPGSRKPSSAAFSGASATPPPPPTFAPPPPSSLAPPPPAAPAPPPPPSPVPRPPSGPPQSHAPPPPPLPPTSPPATNGGGPSLAMQAAIRAAGQVSPMGAPPPPPPPPSNGPPTPSFRAVSPPLPPSPAPPAPAAPMSRSQSQNLGRSHAIDSSSYTLSSNGSLPKNASPNRRLVINDSRWKFADESEFPKPKEFVGGTKKYRAGRGSSVPLDLSAF